MNVKINLLLNIFTFLILSSCSFENKVSCNDLTIEKNIVISKDSAIPYTGTCLLKNENNKLLGKYNFLSGLMDGVQESYFENGNLSMKEIYINGKKDGVQEYYFVNGNLSMKEIYINGKKDGVQEYYFVNGNLMKKEIYINGKKDGVQESYHEYNGLLRDKEIYINGKKDGVQESYFDNRQLSKKEIYVNGKQHGISESYYTNGSLKEKKFFIDGLLDGILETYNRNGLRSNESKYEVGNIKNQKSYNVQGDLVLEENFDKEERYHGVITEYTYRYCDEDSWFCSNPTKLKSKISKTYKNGVLHGEYKDIYQFSLDSPSPATAKPTRYVKKNYINGIVDGRVEFFEYKTEHGYEDLQLSHFYTCKDGKANGVYKKFFLSSGHTGKVFIEGIYKDNKGHGVFKEYRSDYIDKHLYKTITYEDGKPTSCRVFTPIRFGGECLNLSERTVDNTVC